METTVWKIENYTMSSRKWQRYSSRTLIWYNNMTGTHLAMRNLKKACPRVIDKYLLAI